jgi:glycosyltransferase involved in cell wall biosynthesis
MRAASPKPRISIVVPTLNEEKLIASTLKRVREVVPEAELVVADGGSQDATREIARRYARVVKTHGPVGNARNEGAKAARGEIIIFLDADTSISREFVDVVLEVFKDPTIIGAGGSIMPRGINQLEKTVFRFLNFLVRFSCFIGKPRIAGTCVAFKRKPFFDVGGFNTSIAASEDFDLCERISRKGRVVFLKNVITYTSNRRLRKLGLFGLLWDWSKTTIMYLCRRKMTTYRAFR